jgi:hypothetical protein
MTMQYMFSSSLRILAVLLLLETMPAFAQNTESSGEYGTLVSNIGLVRNTKALFIGGRGGWSFDHTFAIGVGGYTLLNDINARIPDTSGNHLMTMSYGGVDLEYISSIGDSYYLTIQALVGTGAIGHKETVYLNPRQYHDPFFVFEPSVSVEIMVTKIFRIGIGASYREVALLESNLASRADLCGASGFLSLKVGFF